jgi:cytoskeletal protein CcmA (bactofilin family)
MATVRLQLRRGLAQDWFDANPTLAPGEIGIETDTNTFKFGDGDTPWRDLDYALSGTVDDYIALSTKGVANGVASLDGAGLIPLAQLPGAAALDAEVDTAVTNHNNATTSVHGIADTSILVTTTGSQTLTSKSLTSPALTGTPTAPTASAGTDTTQVATTAFVQDAIELVVGAAPAALNTLAEIATSLADNADLSGTLTTAISGKVAKSGDTMSGTLNMGTNKITNLGVPTTGTDASTKGYTDGFVVNAITTYSGITTGIHGISDTANLVYTADTRLSDLRVPQDASVSTEKIVDLNVTTAKINDSAVTSAKIADGAVATSELGDLAVTTAKLADSAITLAKIADSAVIAAKIDTGAVQTAKIADSAVTDAKLADSAVTGVKIAANAISQSHLSDDSVGTNEIGGLAVTTAKIADSAVTTDKINNSAVTEGKIGELAVTEGKIADGSVSSAKIATGSIVNSNISASAAIAQSKVDGLVADLALKAPIDAPTFTGTVVLPSTTSIGSVSASEIETLNGITASTSELNYLLGVTSGVQGQIDEKAPTDSPTFTTKVNIDTNNFNVGSDSEDLRTEDGYTNPIAVFSAASTDYAQVAVKNTTDAANSSTDIIVYSSNGDDASGWIDMGITSPSFSDPDFTITGPNDGYIFVEAPAGTTGDGNLVLATGSNGVHNHIVFAAGGLQSNNTQMTIFPDERVHIEIDSPSTSSTTGALTVVGGVGIQGDLNLEGNLDVNGQVDLSGVDVLPIGPGAGTFAESLTNPTVVAVTSHNDYAQIAHQNTSNGANASTDIIMYPNNGADDAGYVNMGITSSAFADPDFTITGPNDGYIFMVAPDGTTGRGDLVLATGATGTRNAIVFAAGGLDSNNEQMVIIPDQNVHIEIATPSVSPTTGALTVVGGVGIQGDLNIEGDVNIEGTIVFGGAGTTVETSNLSVTDPLVFVGDNNASDIIDLGIVGEYVSGGSTKYAGIVRDASDGVVKAFKDASTKPTSSVNFAEAGLAYSDMQVAGLTASSLNVGNVSNTEIGYLDGVTSAIQTQIDTKLATSTASSTYAPIANPTFTGTVAGVTKSHVGLANVDNTSDANKPVSSATQTELNLKSPIASPTFTGTVTLAASGIAFTDKTQTRAGVPSLTTIANAISSSTTLDALGTDANVRDSLVPLSGAVNVSFEATGNAKYAIGSSISFYQSSGTGANITGNGITVLSTPGGTLRALNSSVTATKIAATTWLLAGDLR